VQAYLTYYPDVAMQWPSMQDAARHYVLFGHQEVRLYRRVRVLMHYDACGSLLKQHQSLLAAMSMAAALGADVVIPTPSSVSTGHRLSYSALWDEDTLIRCGDGTRCTFHVL
jgi:hypothetical protein